jgi:thiamine pyrophosphate-dependent acetolactate synthase large subunit-like protein
MNPTDDAGGKMTALELAGMANMPREAVDAEMRWGSDVVARTLRDLRVDYIALNPGASFRGLHDSLVNHLGNIAPHMLLCLHEEHAVAIAHGYAKVTGRTMAVALHSNVGLMHAAMALFNAYCDRVPVLVLDANGPLDAARRRPWIDWIHTVPDPAAPVRSSLKWDDQPGSIPAVVESLTQAHWIARTAPAGPTLVSLDVTLQESPLAAATELQPVTPRPVYNPAPGPSALTAIAEMLGRAQRPVFVFGRTSPEQAAWQNRIDLAERIGAAVITDIRVGAAFPTRHPLHAGFPGYTLSGAARRRLAEADLVVGFDPVDLAGMLAEAGLDARKADVVTISLDPYVHRGTSKDHQRFLPAGTHFFGDPEIAISGLLDTVVTPPSAPVMAETPDQAGGVLNSDGLQDHEERPLGIRDVAGILQRELPEQPRPSYLRLPLGWPGDLVDFRDPLDYLGTDGGAGIGSGPGMAVGAALALRDSARLPLAVLGDGDFVMGATALWTAVSERIRLLVLVMNNRSYLNDELHQIRVARARGRSAENRWVGQCIDDPPIDIAGLANAQGAFGIGPVTSPDELCRVLPDALERVARGGVVVIDVLVRSEFDATSLAQAVVPT